MPQPDNRAREPFAGENCFAGGCIGALLAPLAFLLCLALFLRADEGSGGLIFLFFLSAPIGAIIGIIVYPTARKWAKSFATKRKSR